MAQKKKRQKRKQDKPRQPCTPGFLAREHGKTLRSYHVGALPIINHFLRRMRLPEILQQYLPNDPRSALPTYRALLVLVQNMLLSREPMYGVSQWASKFAPDLLELCPNEVDLLNDDRVGRAIEQLFETLATELMVTVAREVINQFHLELDEMHNDSTTVSFYGAYQQAAEEKQFRGRQTLAITWGHSKAKRPDLKQLLFTLTTTQDGGVPIYFTADSGNTTDDTTHRQTWDLLCQLARRSDFLYVADCKLASQENMNYIARRGGRFITVLPRSRKEDKQFRQRLQQQPESVSWEHVYTKTKTVKTRGIEHEIEIDRLTVAADELLSSEGYRLLWYHSTNKADQDARRRTRNLQRAMRELSELRDRLHGPRPRLKSRQKVEEAVQEILQRLQDESLLIVTVEERQEETYRQAGKGRPGKNTKYIKQVKKRFDVSWSIDSDRLADAETTDGIFPLTSNEKELTAEDLLRAYKRQPIIEKRFSQLKTDFNVAPVHLHSVIRIEGFLAVYFLALTVQALIERELRAAMQRAKIESLPLYPEERDCRRPTARKVFDLFEDVCRHELNSSGSEPIEFVTKLSPLQQQILKLLGISASNYGRPA